MAKKAALLLASAATAVAVGLFLGRTAAEPDRCRACPPAALPAPEPESYYERLGPSKPGDWRHVYKEAPQSVEAYAAAAVNRRCAHRSTIYIQVLESRAGRRGFSPPCEAAYPKVVERMREYLEAFFGTRTVLLAPLPMIEAAYVAERDQYDAGALTEGLAARVPTDAVALVGLTREDLFAPGLNYVFGVGSLERRAGVYSMRRLQTDDPIRFLERALKLVVHETGHIFSVRHCVSWRCVMQGANSAAEQDGQPLRPCPDDLRKLEWNAGFERRARFERLLELHRRYGLAEEAAWIEKRLEP